MEQKIKKLQKHEFLKSLGDELHELWIECGKPEESEGPSTELRGRLQIVVDPEEIGDWSGHEERVACLMTAHRELAYEALGYVYIGSGIVHHQYYSTDAFDEYQFRARDIVETWLVDHYELECDYLNSII